MLLKAMVQDGLFFMQALEPEGSLGMDTVVAILGRFLYLFAASLILGLCFGLGTAFLLKTLQCQSSPQVRFRMP